MKKASFFVPASTIFVAITLITAIILLQIAMNKILEVPIGARQFTLFSTYQRAENALDYLEMSGKYALVDSIFVLANNSGYYGQSDCGRFASFNSWGSSDNNYECYPADPTEDIKPEFFGFFGNILKNTYVEKYNDVQKEDDPGIRLSTYFNFKSEDIVSLAGKDSQTELAMKQEDPDLSIDFKFNGHGGDGDEQVNYATKFSFRTSTEPNVLGMLEYLKNRAGTIYSEELPKTEKAPDGKEYEWHNGGCVDAAAHNIDAQAERFYRFVEAFEDCIQREVTGAADGYGQLKAKCDSYDLSQIDQDYSYLIQQAQDPPTGQPATYLALKYKDNVLWGTYVANNELDLVYRYTCPNGKSDCPGPTARQCTIDLTNEESNCAKCEGIISPPHSCVAGRAFCVARSFGAVCNSGYAEDCLYLCGWDEFPCSPEQMITEVGCPPPIPRYCPGAIVCMFGSCSLSGCPGSTPAPDPEVTDYPKYSYDYAEAHPQQIELKQDSCPADSLQRFCSSANTIQLVKINGNVGFLESNSESIDSAGQLGYKEGTDILQRWQPFGAKKTYRFCVESKDDYLVYKEQADSLLKDSKANMVLDLMPLRYKFAVRVLP